MSTQQRREELKRVERRLVKRAWARERLAASKLRPLPKPEPWFAPMTPCERDAEDGRS